MPGEEGRFNDLFDELDIVATYYSTGQISSLTAFIMREKTINQQDYIICDLTGTTWSQEHVLSAVQQLRRFAIAQLIVIAPSADTTALLFGKLASLRVDDLIAVVEATDLNAEVRKCLTRKDSEGVHQRLYAMQNALATSAAQTAAVLKIPKGMVLNVAVGGAMPRIGTTLQVFGLFHYLHSIGFSPCVFDPSGKLTDILLPLYTEQIQRFDSYLTIKDIPFSMHRMERFNAYIQDVGVIGEGSASLFCAADVRVLIGGTKPWELPALASAVARLKETPGEMSVLISFAADGDMETVGKYLGKHSASAPYSPNIWAPGSFAAYQEAVLPCLKAVCGGSAE